jgi:hypothetical protein
MMYKRPLSSSHLFALALIFLLGNFINAGCVKKKYTCTSCHTDQETLEAVADPIEYPTSTGEG